MKELAKSEDITNMTELAKCENTNQQTSNTAFQFTQVDENDEKN